MERRGVSDASRGAPRLGGRSNRPISSGAVARLAAQRMPSKYSENEKTVSDDAFEPLPSPMPTSGGGGGGGNVTPVMHARQPSHELALATAGPASRISVASAAPSHSSRPKRAFKQAQVF